MPNLSKFKQVHSLPFIDDTPQKLFIFNMKISLVITLLNEEDNVKPLLTNIKEALQGIDYEVILVDDGSTDKTVMNIRQYADERVKLVVLYRNYGQTTAMSAGIDAAQGEYIVTLDGDLQNDPADIPIMLQKAEVEGWDVVAGRRANRQDGFILRKVPSKIANALIRKLTGVYLHDYGCTLKIFRRDIAKNLGLYGELHRFIPVLAALQGAKMVEMDVRHHARIFGTSKYGLGRTFKVMSDLLLMVFFQRYFRRPMHLFGPVGIASTLLGVFINFYLLVLKLLGQDIWGRPLLILGIILLLGGLQLLTFGFITEIQMRTYYESQQKPNYNVKEIFTKAVA
jgi:glycosyltransferase involved in cell wall biosynthesis